MKLVYLIILCPLLSFSQNNIKFYVNDTIIMDKSDSFLHVNIDSVEYNLLDENLFGLLLTVDSFRIYGNIQGVKFESSRLNIMKKVPDSLIVRCNLNIDADKTGLRIRCAPTPIFHEIQICSLRDDCNYFIANGYREQECSLKPAYYIDGKAVFDEVESMHKIRKRAYKKWKKIYANTK
jgi:hypothetical protein